MQQVKLFIGIENARNDLENEINSWLRDNPDIRVTHCVGNVAPQTQAKHLSPADSSGRSFNPSDLFVMIMYEPA